MERLTNLGGGGERERERERERESTLLEIEQRRQMWKCQWLRAKTNIEKLRR